KVQKELGRRLCQPTLPLLRALLTQPHRGPPAHVLLQEEIQLEGEKWQQRRAV
ncbi:hypothetical protein NDU88_002172, partial [Pleurodeles waltl]